MKEILNNKVTLNPVELCSELANKRVFEHYIFYNSDKTEDEIEQMILKDDLDNDTLIYTEDAQELFDEFYDEYYSIIESLTL